jgi:hypothetical protein
LHPPGDYTEARKVPGLWTRVPTIEQDVGAQPDLGVGVTAVVGEELLALCRSKV